MTVNDKLLKLFKNIASGIYESRRPCNIFIGTVKNLDPLIIDCGNIKNIPSDFISISESATDKLYVNAAVIVVKAEGGQKYFIIDRIGNGGD